MARIVVLGAVAAWRLAVCKVVLLAAVAVLPTTACWAQGTPGQFSPIPVPGGAPSPFSQFPSMPFPPGSGAPAAPANERVQIAGTRVTLIPAPGMRSPPGSSILSGENEVFAMIQPLKVGEIEQASRAFKSADVQKLNKWSDVTVESRPRGPVKRLFIKLNVAEAAGITRRVILFMDDSKQATSVVAVMPKHVFEANKSIEATMEQMLETASFTDKDMAVPFDFSVTPPPGYRALGMKGGQVQMFVNGEREFMLLIRSERTASAEDLTVMADVVIPRTLERQLENFETLAEKREKSGNWDYYERSVKGISKAGKYPIEGLVRVQTNTASNETYIALAYALPPLSSGMAMRMRKAFESVKPLTAPK